MQEFASLLATVAVARSCSSRLLLLPVSDQKSKFAQREFWLFPRLLSVTLKMRDDAMFLPTNAANYWLVAKS